MINTDKNVIKDNMSAAIAAAIASKLEEAIQYSFVIDPIWLPRRAYVNLWFKQDHDGNGFESAEDAQELLDKIIAFFPDFKTKPEDADIYLAQKGYWVTLQSSPEVFDEFLQKLNVVDNLAAIRQKGDAELAEAEKGCRAIKEALEEALPPKVKVVNAKQRDIDGVTCISSIQLFPFTLPLKNSWQTADEELKLANAVAEALGMPKQDECKLGLIQVSGSSGFVDIALTSKEAAQALTLRAEARLEARSLSRFSLKPHSIHHAMPDHIY